MSKILLSAAVIAVASLTASSAYAIGGGPTPEWASAWYSPNGASATVGANPAFAADKQAIQPRDETSHGHRAYRHTQKNHPIASGN